MQHSVVLVGTLDTKSEENGFVRHLIEEAGVAVLVIDTSVLGQPGFAADISREDVARAAGVDHNDLVRERDRGHALAVMAAGAAVLVRHLQQEGRIHGAIALGGTGGTSVAAEAFRSLPLGFPKIVISTAASGNTEAYVAETDLILIPSVVDIAGINRISSRILRNAAAAIVGMVSANSGGEKAQADRPMIAASMFGVTTPCVTEARGILEELGYEVLVFHMTGSGGRAMESLISQGFFAGVLDVTTTELADHLVGGVFDAGPTRVTAAGKAGVPQMVSVGALDMVNFGPRDTVPAQFLSRRLYQHNSSVTLMRTTPEECAQLGKDLAIKLASATGPTTLFLPLQGVSAIAVEGGPFHSAEADEALFSALRVGIAGSGVELVEVDTDINDPSFARRMVEALDLAIRTA